MSLHKPRKYKGDKYHKVGNFFYSIAFLFDRIGAYFTRIGDKKNV